MLFKGTVRYTQRDTRNSLKPTIQSMAGSKIWAEVVGGVADMCGWSCVPDTVREAEGNG